MSSKRPESAKLDAATPAVAKRPQDWSPLERAQAVVEAAGLSEESLGEFLRGRGLHREQLEEWQRVLEESLAGGTAGRRSADSKRIRQLERELVRKDKALAETTALLVLKKRLFREIRGSIADGRALLQSHFESVVTNPLNITRSFTSQYGTFQVRESLFAGPGGFVKFESTWQVLEGGGLRFTTAIPFGGP